MRVLREATRRIFRVVAAAALLALPLEAAEKAPRTDEPFYRKYLVPGNPLDEKILQQEKRVQANPDSADLRNDFGNLLAARRFPKQAQDQYETAMTLDRSNYLAPYNLGLLYETEGKISRAIRAYKESVDRNRGFPPSRFRLGRLYEKRGWQQRAIEQYARALRIDPEMRDPRRNPLVVDSRLMDRVSLENYAKDLATASLAQESGWADPARFRRVPLDRPVATEDLADAGAPEAADAANPGSTPRAPAPLPPRPGEVRPQALGGTAAPPPPAPAPTSPPPAPTPYRPIIMPAPLPTPPQ